MPPSDAAPTRLFLGGLPLHAEASVSSELLPRFAALGNAIASWEPMRDALGHFRGFGYVQFKAGDAARVVQAFHNARWKGQKLRLETAQEDYTVRLQREKADVVAALARAATEREEEQAKLRERIAARRAGLPRDTWLIRDKSGERKLRVQSAPQELDRGKERQEGRATRRRSFGAAKGKKVEDLTWVWEEEAGVEAVVEEADEEGNGAAIELEWSDEEEEEEEVAPLQAPAPVGCEECGLPPEADAMEEEAEEEEEMEKMEREEKNVELEKEKEENEEIAADFVAEAEGAVIEDAKAEGAMDESTEGEGAAKASAELEDQDLGEKIAQETGHALSLLSRFFGGTSAAAPAAPAAPAAGDGSMPADAPTPSGDGRTASDAGAVPALGLESGGRVARSLPPRKTRKERLDGLLQKRYDPRKEKATQPSQTQTPSPAHNEDAGNSEDSRAPGAANGVPPASSASSPGVEKDQGRTSKELDAYQTAFYREHTLDTVKPFTDHVKTKTASFSFGFSIAADAAPAAILPEASASQQAGGIGEELASSVGVFAGTSEAGRGTGDAPTAEALSGSAEAKPRTPAPCFVPIASAPAMAPHRAVAGSQGIAFWTPEWLEGVQASLTRKRQREALGGAEGEGGKRARRLLRGSRATFLLDYKRKLKAARRESSRHRSRGRGRS